MGKSFSMLCFILLAMFSCKKDEIATDTDILFAKWKLVKTTGTITGAGITTDWNILELTADNVKFYKDNNLLASGTYKMDEPNSKITFLLGESPANIIDLRLDPIKNISLDGKEKLLLNSDCCDRVNYELSRQ